MSNHSNNYDDINVIIEDNKELIRDLELHNQGLAGTFGMVCRDEDVTSAKEFTRELEKLINKVIL